ncbi:hypothetical protein DRQ53_04520 [bacterium]|nr:MAG: hypothetical protein DRQ32_09285 [bacterium]RKZ17096.1 MAG: hypothetical protein DRQ53_04520 [bacterium]
MKSNGAKRIFGWALLVLGVLALVAGPGHRQSLAADPDRYISEPDYEARFNAEDLEATLEEALSGLEEMGDLDVLGDMDFGEFAEELVEHLSEAFEHGAVRVDRDWPDEVRVYGDDLDFRFDTRELARELHRVSRTVERDLMREFGRVSREADRYHGDRDGHGRAWRVDDMHRDRREIELEMRSLRQEMRRLERELEDLEEDI